MLALLDLRTRRERLEPRHLEIDPSIAETVRGIIERAYTSGEPRLVVLDRPEVPNGTRIE